MDRIVMEVAGYNGQVKLLEDRLIISREGMIAFLSLRTNEGRVFPLNELAAVRVQNPGFLSNGYIHFVPVSEANSDQVPTQPNRHPNVVTFTKHQRDSFMQLKNEVEKRIQAVGPGTVSTNVLDFVEKLADLRDKGILSEDEFERKKKQVLGL